MGQVVLDSGMELVGFLIQINNLEMWETIIIHEAQGRIITLLKASIGIKARASEIEGIISEAIKAKASSKARIVLIEEIRIGAIKMEIISHSKQVDTSQIGRTWIEEAINLTCQRVTNLPVFFAEIIIGICLASLKKEANVLECMDLIKKKKSNGYYISTKFQRQSQVSLVSFKWMERII
jgi:hypothetical protein